MNAGLIADRDLAAAVGLLRDRRIFRLADERPTFAVGIPVQRRDANRRSAEPDSRRASGTASSAVMRVDGTALNADLSGFRGEAWRGVNGAISREAAEAAEGVATMYYRNEPGFFWKSRPGRL